MRSLAAVFVAAVLSGCFGVHAPAGDRDTDAPTLDEGDWSMEPASGANARRLVYEFAMDHPLRDAQFPTYLDAARSYLEASVAARGLRVERQAYSGEGANILGFIDGGRFSDEWFVLSCHYDTVNSPPLFTVYGARDDGLGCAALLESARAFAKRQWNHTIVFAFFDQEEDGLVGSEAFVKAVSEAGSATLGANVNLDPAGLHYPCGDELGPYDVNLVFDRGKAEGDEPLPGYAELVRAVRDGLASAGVPAGSVNVASKQEYGYVNVQERHAQIPGADYESFDAADVPSVWLGAPPLDEVGPVKAWGYPNHTVPDTAQVVEERCGGAEILEAGLGVAMGTTASALAALDGVRLV